MKAFIPILCGCLFGCEPSPGPPVTPSNGRTVKAHFSSTANALIVRNSDDFDWGSMTIYVNGNPPFSWKATIPPMKAGEEKRFALSDFTKDDGERFQPSRYKLTEVWIGSNAFDYSKYGF